MTTPRPDSRFAPSSVPAHETGVFLALNAIANAVLVTNSPRCSFFRGMKVFAHNDLASTVYDSLGHHRLITTEWKSYEEVMGDEETFSRMLQQAIRDFPDHWIFTFQNISSWITAFDLPGLSQLAGAQASQPVLALDGPRLDLDWLAGFDELLSKVLAHLLRPDAQARECDLLMVGHRLCRNEADERANVAELRRHLDALGLHDSVVLLSGGELSLSALAPAACAVLPDAGVKCRSVLADRKLAQMSVPLPLGIRGTVEWLRSIGRLTGREQAAEELIDKELARLIPEIQWAVAEHLVGRTVAVVADPVLGRSLVDFLGEIGIQTRAVLTMSRSGKAEPGRNETVDPAPEQVADLFAGGDVDVVIGGGFFTQLALDADIPCVEIGFPAYLSHAIFPKPYLGFEGARYLIDALLNALLRRDAQPRAAAPAVRDVP